MRPAHLNQMAESNVALERWDAINKHSMVLCTPKNREMTRWKHHRPSSCCTSSSRLLVCILLVLGACGGPGAHAKAVDERGLVQVSHEGGQAAVARKRAFSRKLQAPSPSEDYYDEEYSTASDSKSNTKSESAESSDYEEYSAENPGEYSNEEASAGSEYSDGGYYYEDETSSGGGGGSDSDSGYDYTTPESADYYESSSGDWEDYKATPVGPEVFAADKWVTPTQPVAQPAPPSTNDPFAILCTPNSFEVYKGSCCAFCAGPVTTKELKICNDLGSVICQGSRAY